MCDGLQVSKSGYYAWKHRPASSRQIRREELMEQISESYKMSDRTYGSPRVYLDLKEAGVAVCENTVARYMRQASMAAKSHRRFRVLTTDSSHDQPIAANRLERRFEASAPDRKWCCDITYIPTGEGWLYLACVIDLFSRRIVGWAMADHLRAELPLEALNMAVHQRQPGPDLLHHSDRGVQYACEAYRAMLDRHNMTASMSRRGNCHDNAVMESFFGTLKTELVHHERYRTRADARSSIFRYIEGWYNRRRRHSAIGYMSPEQFEASRN